MTALQTRSPAAALTQRTASAPRDAISVFEPIGARRNGHTGGSADSVTRRFLAVGDAVAAVGAFAATLALVGGDIAVSVLAAAIVVVPINKLLGLYDRDAYVLNKTTLDDLPRLVNASTMLAVVGAGSYDLVGPGDGAFSARHLVLLAAITALALAIGRVTTRAIAQRRVSAERCLVIGGRDDCDELRRKLSLSPTVNAAIVARAPLSACGSPGLRDIRDVLVRCDVDRVIVVPDEARPDEVSEAIRAIKSFDVKISIVPRLFEAIGSSIERDEICGTELMGVKDFRMTSSSRMVKRSLDATAAAIGLLLVAPVFVAVAILVKLDSAGPALYRQRRIGRDGDGFSMIKFRTMVDGADRQKEALRTQNETAGLFKIANDPRVTRVGRLLRNTSLDELPQLINVLRGDMSLVGPRPLVPDEDENITGWYRRRSHITPGITGVWQLHGPVRIPLHEMVKLDYTYVADWSLWGDIKILLRTVLHVVGRRGL
ncbi:MAG: exopolysaccharide biosynthesis polyprenyl glycosylphosphotransferase [Solirubrobacterales bacterium]